MAFFAFVDDKMPRIIAAIVISLIAGFAVGAWVGGDKPEFAAGPSANPAAGNLDQTAPLEERLLSLEQVIAEEREARLILQQQLQSLVEAIERIDSSGPQVYADRAARAEVSRQTRSGNRNQRDFAARMRDMQDRRAKDLMDGGFSEDEARRLLQQESKAEYKALQSSYEAQRSGEALNPFTVRTSPQSILRAELGDSDYERYLAAQGQRTSIEITQVLDGSPGSQAGLQSGDAIVSYSGERVFNVSELRELTMQGNPGEDVIVEIDRNGVRMQLSVQRGPVGIVGSGANVRGMNWWGGG